MERKIINLKDVVVVNFQDSGRPFFRASIQCVCLGILEKEGWTMYDSFQCGSFEFSIYGAMAEWCDELTQQIPGQSFSSMENSIENRSLWR